MPIRPASGSWMQGLDLPTRLLSDETYGGSDYELYEEDGEFVLTIDMPGFEPEEIDLAWDDGLLNVAAEHVDERRDRKKTFHRRFRFPKEIDDDAIEAEYTNGVLEIRLPVLEGATAQGKTIPVQG